MTAKAKGKSHQWGQDRLRHRQTLFALAQVDAGMTVPHAVVRAWANKRCTNASATKARHKS